MIQDYLDLWYLSWNIDMFDLSELSGGHPLYFSGVWLMEEMNILSYFPITKDCFHRWLLMMEAAYHPHPYHNCIHAADVLHSLKFLAFGDDSLSEKFTNVEKLAGIIAAIGHDVDHPGYTNQFLVKTRHEFAILYSDASVNEYHHAAHVFQITSNSDQNIFSEFSPEEYEELRRIIIRLILCTDMAKHFEYLTRFKAKLVTNVLQKLDTQENRLIVMEIAIKCSDLNNPSKAPGLAVKWVDSIMEEFYRQGDEEREAGLPISQFMDRNAPNIAKCQIGFIDILVAPMFEAWSLYKQGDQRTRSLRHNIKKNREHWAAVSQNAERARLHNESSFVRTTSLASSDRRQPIDGKTPLNCSNEVKLDVDIAALPPLPLKSGSKDQIPVD
ncbi:hypothetical protein DFJ73DRAFT_635164 [Zopfochytrium polystomum]|nr:hypothetical protein DFJ73DRAFT_635164 [Zopfochytrium polystomum]